MVAADMLVFVLTYFIKNVLAAHIAVQHVPVAITWNQARTECWQHGLENHDDYLMSSGIPEDKEFWIGTIIDRVLTRWFEIIGCFEIKQHNIYSSHSVTSVGQCKLECDAKNIGLIFGYRKNLNNDITKNCVCLTNMVERKQQQNITDCYNSAYFYVYKDFNGTVRNSSNPGNCATICCGDCHTVTQNLNNLEGRSCSLKDSSIVGRCGTSSNSPFHWGLDYSRSLDFCQIHNLLLPSSNYCQQQTEFTGQVSWTNVFRVEVIQSQDTDLNRPSLRCFSGRLHRQFGKIKLIKTKQNCSETMEWFICKTSSVVTKMETHSLFHTKDISKTKLISTSPSKPYTQEKENTNRRSTGTTFKRNIGYSNDQTDNGNNSTSIGAVIGGILGACSLLAVAAVLIVCKLRSNGIFKEAGNNDKGNTNQVHLSKTISQESNITSKITIAITTSNQTYGVGETSTAVYAVVNKLKEMETIQETYNDGADGEYDHLHELQNRIIVPQENVYNSHGASRNEDDPTYDSSDFGNAKFMKANITYDKSFSVIEGDYT